MPLTAHDMLITTLTIKAHYVSDSLKLSQQRLNKIYLNSTIKWHCHNKTMTKNTQRDRSRIGTKTSHFRDQEMIP